MYNSNLPDQQSLPSAGQLVRSTLLALLAALVLLFTVVLPAEYAIDPTGVGRMLGLTQMGEIKEQLAEEAAADRAAAANPAPVTVTATAPVAATTQPVAAAVAQPVKTAPAPQPVSAVPVAAAVATVAAEPAIAEPAAASSKDEISFVLVPGQGAEVKLEMKEGAKVRYRWTANGGKLNYDTHGDPYKAPRGFYHGYGKGRFQPEDSGVLTAAFDGKHGWFWRNRTKEPVTLTLTTEGDYIQMQRVL